MLILAICRPAEGADPAEFQRLLRAEAAALREVKSNGVLNGFTAAYEHVQAPG